MINVQILPTEDGNDIVISISEQPEDAIEFMSGQLSDQTVNALPSVQLEKAFPLPRGVSRGILQKVLSAKGLEDLKTNAEIKVLVHGELEAGSEMKPRDIVGGSPAKGEELEVGMNALVEKRREQCRLVILDVL